MLVQCVPTLFPANTLLSIVPNSDGRLLLLEFASEGIACLWVRKSLPVGGSGLLLDVVPEAVLIASL
jgi:hypothetical protein